LLNALSFDIEEHFQVSGFADHIDPADWDDHESRVVPSTEKILSILNDADTKATFFFLGWVAERSPSLVRAVVEEGHEIATHGHAHRLVYDLSPEEFRDDLRRSIDAIASEAGGQILGFRATSFSITERSLWALDILREEGLTYDASVFPIKRERYGIPDAPREPYRHENGLIEFPSTVGRWWRLKVPVGGGYFRLFPYAFTRSAIRGVNAAGSPAISYHHPWEFDPEQPRMKGDRANTFRHYVGLRHTAGKLERLCRDFSFGPIAEVLEGIGLSPSKA